MSPRQTTGRLKEWRPGERIRAERLNEPVAAINSLVSGVAPSGQVVRQARGAVVVFRRAVVRSVSADHIAVRFVDADGNVAADETLVAKPWLLRRTPFDGQARAGVTYTYSSDTQRDATDGTDTETQVVVPSYEVDDVVYCAKLGADVVGLTVGQSKLEWLDINVDGRAWAEQAQ